MKKIYALLIVTVISIISFFIYDKYYSKDGGILGNINKTEKKFTCKPGMFINSLNKGKDYKEQKVDPVNDHEPHITQNGFGLFIDLNDTKSYSLKDIDFSQCKGIERLHIRGNKNSFNEMTNLSELRNLEFLDIETGNISKIEGISDLKKLVSINLDENSIQEINNFGDFPSLEWLSVISQHEKGKEVIRKDNIDNTFDTLKLNDFGVVSNKGFKIITNGFFEKVVKVIVPNDFKEKHPNITYEFERKGKL